MTGPFSQLVLGLGFFGLIGVIVATRRGRRGRGAGQNITSPDDSTFWPNSGSSSSAETNAAGDRDGDGDVDAADASWDDDSSDSDDSSNDSGGSDD